MSNFVETIKQFYSQGYKKVYDEGQPLEVARKKWSFHIHGLGVEPAAELDESSINSYIHTLRFDFNLELIWHTPEPRNATYTTNFGDYLVSDSMLRDDDLVPDRETIREWNDDLEYEILEDLEIDPRFLGIEDKINQLPDSVWESCRFYSKNISEQDWGNVYTLRITIENQDTLIIRTTTDGSDGWLEVFDSQGVYLAAARISENGDGIAWRPMHQIREYVLGERRYPPELE
ncbi:hypothetical protein [Aliterella atlantica]|uniref:Uncharacterized protein n=1 Tax=Aliterella atlantica CENA595 TaxID=1618023 RepID=A0A0D9A274_9CYAN|nr:hypothetical protein [Aliterella atlantica]KJH73576.1 hypothetical protein UH38_02125 [Aliterella atlantica CENA595]